MVPTLDADNDPPWLRVARGELGVKETPGRAANPRILEYFSATKLVPLQGDETSWCSAFMCWVMEQSGIVSPRRANARSWLTWGQTLRAPQRGCIVVLSRGQDPTFGHVGLWLGDSHERMLLLGGNQGNAVSVAAYPKLRLLGYRWPAGVPAPSPMAA